MISCKPRTKSWIFKYDVSYVDIWPEECCKVCIGIEKGYYWLLIAEEGTDCIDLEIATRQDRLFVERPKI